MANIDPILQHFVSLANTTGVGIHIILNVNGILISGNIISAQEYSIRLWSTISDGHNLVNPGQVDEKTAQVLADHFSKIFRPLVSSDIEDKSGEIEIPDERWKLAHFSKELKAFRDSASVQLRVRNLSMDISEKQDPKYIHLENARIVEPQTGSNHPIDAEDKLNVRSLWRGSLASIDGFILGDPRSIWLPGIL